MSIESNISIVFYSDCNTFATPTDSTCAVVESLKKSGGGWAGIWVQLDSALMEEK
jgi:hypothetical protein